MKIIGEEDENNEIYRSVDPLILNHVHEANLVKESFLNYHFEHREQYLIDRFG